MRIYTGRNLNAVAREPVPVPNVLPFKEPVMDPDASMLAKECTKLGGFAPPTLPAGIVG